MGKISMERDTGLSKEQRENLAKSGQRKSLNNKLPTKKEMKNSFSTVLSNPAQFKSAFLNYLDNLAAHGEIPKHES